MRFSVLISILILLPLACSDSGLGPDNPLVDLTTSVSPEGEGTVNPPEGTYESGKEITIEAIDSNPTDSLQFLSWSGDTTATDNPLTFDITEDMHLTANFGKPDFSLTTSVTPEGAGSVSPSSGEFQIDTEVEVEATASDGYYFQEWTGDISSTENPLVFTIESDTEITAVFEEGMAQQAFTHQVSVSDGVNPPANVYFGMNSDATAGFDSGLDRDLPPPPPGNGFDARFSIPDYGLAEDYRPIRDEETQWTMQIQSADTNDVTLSWDFSNSNHVGSLTLSDDPENPSFEVDMKSETSHQVTGTTQTTLYIISER